MSWTLRALAAAAHGVVHGRDVTITGVSTDTRTLVSAAGATMAPRADAGPLFVPLRGEHFDGHAFIDAAFAGGAIASMVAGDSDRALDDDRSYLEVPDTLRALGDLAAAWVRALPALRVGITGSNGKSTAKEYVAAALAAHGLVHRTHGNHNNLVGAPQTAFGLDKSHRFGVFELGMSVAGEMARLVEIVGPHVGVITSIGPAHLAGLGTVDAIEFEKSRVFAGLGPNGVAVVNGFDPRVKKLAAPGRRVVVGPDATADIVVSRVRRDGVAGFSAAITVGGKSHTLGVRTLARHDMVNAALAVGVVHALGLDVAPSIAAIQKQNGVPGRLRWTVSPTGVNVIDDTYNANPSSMRAAIEALSEVGSGARCIAVLGDMRELGETAPALHAQIGAVAADVGVEALYVVGQHADDYASGFDGDKVTCGDDVPDVLPHLLKHVRRGDWVLVKGSRGSRMERVVKALLGEAA